MADEYKTAQEATTFNGVSNPCILSRLQPDGNSKSEARKPERAGCRTSKTAGLVGVRPGPAGFQSCLARKSSFGRRLLGEGQFVVIGTDNDRLTFVEDAFEDLFRQRIFQ